MPSYRDTVINAEIIADILIDDAMHGRLGRDHHYFNNSNVIGNGWHQAWTHLNQHMQGHRGFIYENQKQGGNIYRAFAAIAGHTPQDSKDATYPWMKGFLTQGRTFSGRFEAASIAFPQTAASSGFLDLMALARVQVLTSTDVISRL